MIALEVLLHVVVIVLSPVTIIAGFASDAARLLSGRREARNRADRQTRLLRMTRDAVNCAIPAGSAGGR